MVRVIGIGDGQNGFQRFPVACDPGDLLQARIMDEAGRGCEDIDGSLFQSPMVLVPVLGEVSGGFRFPVDRGEDIKRFRSVALHGEDVVRRLGDQGRGLACGVQRIHRDDMSRDIAPLQKILGGRDLTPFIVEVQHGERCAGLMICEGHSLIVPRAVAIGGTDALAVRRQRLGKGKTRACPAMHDVFQGFRIDRLEYAMDGGLGDRDIVAGLRVAPGTHGLELGLGEGARKLRGRDTALHVGQFGEDMHREDAGHRVLASLRPAKVGNVREFCVERAQRRQILRGTAGIGWRPHIRGKIAGPGEQPLQILA